MRDGFDMDLRVVSQKSYGSALQYFTGSKQHNIKIREIAGKKGLKINEYGVFKGKKKIAGKEEVICGFQQIIHMTVESSHRGTELRLGQVFSQFIRLLYFAA